MKSIQENSSQKMILSSKRNLSSVYILKVHNKNTRTRGDICSNPKITAVELRQLTKRKIFFPPTPLIFIKLREKLLNMSITGDYLDTTEH